jgi:queuine tRNA-ribosyltransferase
MMSCLSVVAKERQARRGLLTTHHGVVETPAFMPVATQGTVKGLTPLQVRELGASIVLSNTYHLHLRPGDEQIRDFGGLHKFMGWDGPILTDSGGYQVFSLAKLRSIKPEGVVFNSHHDGAKVFLSPEKVIEIQENLGVDIMMVLDECLPADSSIEATKKSWSLTLDWARRSRETKKRSEALIFGIAQGAMHEELRVQACRDLIQLDFDGYAVGGVSVGETTEQMRKVTKWCCEVLPENKIRYLMGVGTPLDIVQSVALGVDLFDCVIPTRSARFGRIYTEMGSINIRNSKYRSESSAISSICDCYSCKNFSSGYISHLIHAKEMLGVQLATLHNLRFYQRLMSSIREHISAGTFSDFCEEVSKRWGNEVKCD